MAKDPLQMLDKMTNTCDHYIRTVRSLTSETSSSSESNISAINWLSEKSSHRIVMTKGLRESCFLRHEDDHNVTATRRGLVGEDS